MTAAVTSQRVIDFGKAQGRVGMLLLTQSMVEQIRALPLSPVQCRMLEECSLTLQSIAEELSIQSADDLLGR